MKRIYLGAFIFVMTLSTYAEVDLETFNDRVSSFCNMESKSSLMGHNFVLTRQLKTKNCIDSNNLIKEVPEYLLDVYGFPRTKVVEKSLGSLCGDSGRSLWKKHKLMAHNFKLDLPKDPCICDMVENFDETKKAICSTQDSKHPIKRQIQKNTDKLLITHSIQQEREAEHLLDQMRYYGVEYFCGEVDIQCDGAESLYNDIDLELSEDEKLYSFTKKNNYNPVKYLSSLKNKKGHFYQPKLKLSSEELKKYLEKNRKKGFNGTNSVRTSLTSSALQEVMGKSSHQYMLNMNKLRVEVGENGNSFSKYIEKNSNSEDSDKVIKNFCKFNEDDSEELKKIKVDILTHDSLSSFSCADDAGPLEIEKNSKALVDLINKSSKNVKKHKFLADAIRDDLKEKFLEEVPERCGNLKKRAEFLCKVPTLKVNEVISLANEIIDSDSRVGLINQNNDRFVELSLEDKANESLSCLMGPKVENVDGNSRIAAWFNDVTSPPRDGKSEPLPSEADRSVAEQKAEYDKKMAELAMAESVRNKVQVFAKKKGIKEGSKEYTDLVNQFEDYIPKSLRGTMSIGMSDLDFFKAKTKLENEFKTTRDQNLNKTQKSLINKYKKLASTPNGLKYYKDNLSSIKNDIDEVSKITGNQIPKNFTDKYFSDNAPKTKVAQTNVFGGPSVYQNAPGVEVRDYGSNVSAAVVPQSNSNTSNANSYEAVPSNSKGSGESAKNASSKSGVSSKLGSYSSKARAPASISGSNLNGTSLLVKNNEELEKRVGEFTSEVEKEGFGIIYISGKKVFKKLVRNGEEESSWPREIKLSEFENDDVEGVQISPEEKLIMKELVLNSKKRVEDLNNILKSANN
jgi:hypothetical protein